MTEKELREKILEGLRLLTLAVKEGPSPLRHLKCIYSAMKGLAERLKV